MYGHFIHNIYTSRLWAEVRLLMRYIVWLMFQKSILWIYFATMSAGICTYPRLFEHFENSTKCMLVYLFWHLIEQPKQQLRDAHMYTYSLTHWNWNRFVIWTIKWYKIGFDLSLFSFDRSLDLHSSWPVIYFVFFLSRILSYLTFSLWFIGTASCSWRLMVK